MIWHSTMWEKFQSITNMMAGVEEEECFCASWVVLPDLLVHSACEDLLNFACSSETVPFSPFPVPPSLLSLQSHHVPVGFTGGIDVSGHLSELHVPACKMQPHSSIVNRWLGGWCLTRGFLSVLNQISNTDPFPDLG